MQFDVFDKKVKKAADHHHPAYDEQAWARMEKLLNTHLPQKEGRRRFLFWFLLFAGLGGAGLIAIRPWKSNQPITAVPKQPSSEPAAPSSLTPGSREADNKFPAGPDKRLITPAENHPNNNSNRMVFSDRSKHSNNRIPASATITTGNGYPLQPAGKLIAPQDNDPGPKQTTQPSGKTNPAPVLATEKEGQSPPGIAGNPPLSTAKDLVNKPQQPGLLNGKSEVVTQKNKEKPKKKAAKSSSFFFTLSAGPDISFVSKNKPGNTELLAGAGLGFSFNKRFTIRTGFYSGRYCRTGSLSSACCLLCLLSLP